MTVKKPDLKADRIALKRDRDELARKRDRAAVVLMEREGLDFFAAYGRILDAERLYPGAR